MSKVLSNVSVSVDGGLCSVWPRKRGSSSKTTRFRDFLSAYGNQTYKHDITENEFLHFILEGFGRSQIGIPGFTYHNDAIWQETDHEPLSEWAVDENGNIVLWSTKAEAPILAEVWVGVIGASRPSPKRWGNRRQHCRDPTKKVGRLRP